MEHIVLQVTYTGEPGKAKAFAEEMHKTLRSEALREDGCMQYDYFLPVGDDKTALLLEMWRDKQSLAAHSSGEVMQKILPLKEKYGLATSLRRFA